MKGLLLGLKESDLNSDPLAQFKKWFAQARAVGLPLPESFMLATATRDGKPSARMILLKGVDKGGFVFYTNYESRKADELASNPQASAVFHWNELFRQIRIEGRIEKVSPAESEKYFHSRARGSQIGAWASRQSTVIPTRADLEKQVSEIKGRYRGQQVPLPPFWGGYRIMPDRIEFWQGRPDRLHDRFVYAKDGQGWKISRLSP